MKDFLPEGVEPPMVLKTPDFCVRPLLIADVVKDYDAVMSSADHLQGVFGPSHTWPHGLSFEQDLIDLGWHEKEFQLRRSFAYKVLSADETRYVGCVYVNPTRLTGYDAEAFCWVRASCAGALDAKLFETVKAWIAEAWPFASVAYPGRTLSWTDVQNFAATSDRS